MGKRKVEFIDIHEYDKRYESTLRQLKSAKISERNKELILKFDETMGLLERLKKSRRLRVIGYLKVFAEKYLKKDFDKATKEDLKGAIKLVDEADYTAWTKQGYRGVVKKFYRWLEYGDEFNDTDKKHIYPKEVSWISTNVKSSDQPKISASDILTEIEITKFIAASVDNKRDEAIIATLYESGCRIGEHGSVRLKHVKKESGYYILTVKGKTGTRETFIVKFASILSDWLNVHPFKDDPESPLWVANKSTPEPLKYQYFKQLVKRIARKAGIGKRIYPHIFRHSRVTHGVVNGEFTMDGAKKLFGWCPETRMLDTYLHITSKDVKDNYLEKLGMKAKREDSLLNPKICPACHHPNLYNASICEHCQALLDSKLSIQKDARLVAMAKFVQSLSEDKYVAFRIEEMAKEHAEFRDIIRTIAQG